MQLQRMSFALAGLLLALPSLSLAQSAHNGPPQALPEHQDDPAPSLPDYEVTIRAYLADHAYDPDSVTIREITPPRHMMWGGGWINGPMKSADISCVTWNAKNRYGGFVGFSTDAFLLEDGRVKDVYDGGVAFGILPETHLCPPR